MPHIEIISHPFCPYTHRLVLMATAKGWKAGTDYQITHLPYKNLPQLLPQHSPTGVLPVLKVDGVLRSATTTHIAEYINAQTGLGLLPNDANLRLIVRERELRVGSLLDSMRTMFAGLTVADVHAAVDKAFELLQGIDADLATDGTTEQTMRMEIAALEPAFTLLLFFPVLAEHPHWQRTPRLYGIALLSVQNTWLIESACPNYGFEFEEFFSLTHSAFPEAMNLSRPIR
jgi:glutathione S-transferase